MNRDDEVFETINNEISKPIGIFGARGSGKTVYFSMLYGTGGDNELAINLKYEEENNEKYYITKEYLKSNYSKLLDQKLPDATIDGDDLSIKIEFNYKKRKEKLYTYEYAGELVEAAEKMEEDQRKHHDSILEFFSKCSGIIIFLEPFEKKGSAFKKDMNIEKLISFLKSKKIDIPIGIAITKWDKVRSNISYDREVEKKEVIKYIKENTIYKNIYNRISNSVLKHEIFPISSYGHHEEIDIPPKELKPFNLYEPIKWLSENKEFRIKEIIKKEIQKSSSLSSKKKLFELFKKKYSNSQYEVEILDIIEKYKKNKIQKSKRILLGFILLVLVGFIYLNVQQKIKIKNEFNEIVMINDQIEKDQMLKKFEKKYGSAINFKEILEKERVDIKSKINKMMKKEYENIINEDNIIIKKELINNFRNKYKNNSKYETDLINQLVKIKEIRQKQAYNRIQEENNRNIKLELINSFIENNGEKNIYSRELISERKKIEYFLAVNREYIDLEEEILNNNLSYYEKYIEIQNFINKYKLKTEGFINKMIDELKNKISKILEKADDEKFQDIKSFVFNYQGNFDKIKENIIEYLNIDEFTRHRKEIQQILKKEEKNEEKKYLFAIKDAIQGYNRNKTYINCKYIVDTCDNYFSLNISKRYENKVEQIKSEAENFIQNKQLIYFRFKLKGTFNTFFKSNKVDIIFGEGNNTQLISRKIKKEADYGSYDIKINFKSQLIFKFIFKDKDNIGTIELTGEELLTPSITKSFISTRNQKKVEFTIENSTLYRYKIKDTIAYVE